jgi:hypothetical protein
MQFFISTKFEAKVHRLQDISIKNIMYRLLLRQGALNKKTTDNRILRSDITIAQGYISPTEKISKNKRSKIKPRIFLQLH